MFVFLKRDLCSIQKLFIFLRIDLNYQLYIQVYLKKKLVRNITIMHTKKFINNL
jgi:hypothetical protein